MKNYYFVPDFETFGRSPVRNNYQVGIGFRQDDKYVYSGEEILESQDRIARRIEELTQDYPKKDIEDYKKEE